MVPNIYYLIASLLQLTSTEFDEMIYVKRNLQTRFLGTIFFMNTAIAAEEIFKPEYLIFSENVKIYEIVHC